MEKEATAAGEAYKNGGQCIYIHTDFTFKIKKQIEQEKKSPSVGDTPQGT